jgi:hypothetical protein
MWVRRYFTNAQARTTYLARGVRHGQNGARR